MNSRRMRIARIVATVVLVLGVLLVLYPYVSDWTQQHNRVHSMDTYSETVESAPSEELQDEMAAAQDFNVRLLKGRTVVTDPFDPEQQGVTTAEYESLLNLNGDGMMGTLKIPAIGLNLPIYHGTSDEVLQHSVGHLEATSLPVGGLSTHCVLAGHSGLVSTKIFDDIVLLEEGDWIMIHVLGEVHYYQIYAIDTVLPEETDSLVIDEGNDLLTLVTCVPYGVNTHRLLVKAQREEYVEPETVVEIEETPQRYQITTYTMITLVALAVILVVFLVTWTITRRKARGKHGRKR